LFTFVISALFPRLLAIAAKPGIPNFKAFKRFGAFKGLVEQKNVVFNSFVCKLGLFWPTRAKKDPIYTQTRQINYYLFLDQAIWRMQKKGKNTLKKHYKFACFYAPQNVFLFLDQAIWRMQKSLKNDQKNHPKSQTTPLRNNKMSQLLHLQKNLKINQKSAHQFTRSLKYENLQKISPTRLVGAKFLAYFDT
jgi:hypothetical protein